MLSVLDCCPKCTVSNKNLLTTCSQMDYISDYSPAQPNDALYNPHSYCGVAFAEHRHVSVSEKESVQQFALQFSLSS